MSQYEVETTHVADHTLDVVITRVNGHTMLYIAVTDPGFSDSSRKNVTILLE